jgi:WD40 repeat protein
MNCLANRVPIVVRVLAAVAAALVVSAARADLVVGNFFDPSLDVLRYDNSGAFVSTFVPSHSGGLSFPLGGVFGPDGNFYVSDSDHDTVLRYNGSTGAFIDAFVPAGNAEDPAGLVFGPDGNLYVASSSAPGAVLRFNGTTGASLGEFVTAGSGGLSDPEELTFGPDGNLYVASGDTDSVLEYDGTTGAFIRTFASGNGLSSPRGLAFGPDDNLYVSNFGYSSANGAVLRFDGSTGAFIDDFVSGDLATNGGVQLPRPLVFGPDGNLYVGGFGSGDVLLYNGTTGGFISVFVPAGSGGLGGPTFMVFHDFAPTPVSEPPMLVLVAFGLAGVAVFMRRRPS